MKTSATMILSMFLLLSSWLSDPRCSAQRPAEVESLQLRIKELEAELAKAHSEIETLNKKVVALSTPSGKSSKKGLDLSERLSVGVKLEGDYRSRAVAGIGRISMVIQKRDGVKLFGTSTLSVEGKDLGESRWEGEVRGNRLTMERVGSGNKVKTTLELKGDVLEGGFMDSQGNIGSIGLRFP